MAHLPGNEHESKDFIISRPALLAAAGVFHLLFIFAADIIPAAFSFQNGRCVHTAVIWISQTFIVYIHRLHRISKQ